MTTWKVGEVRITSVTEFEMPTPAAALVPDATAENLATIDWIGPYVTEKGYLRILIQALLIESQGKRVIVDTCVGNDKDRTLPVFDHLSTGFLHDLEQAGFPPDRIDLVLCTHLHVDHVGWNTMLVDGRWQPTFPNARYLVVDREWAFWSAEDDQPFGDVIGDSVRPIFDAGLADLVPVDHAVTDEIRLDSTPGHTPGHVSVRIASGGEEAVITGDLMHHPSQCAHPEWGSSADEDAELARATRRAFLEAEAGSGRTVIGTHFAGPWPGTIVREGGAFRFDRIVGR